tara:strand:+ start:25 stop:597 length:573 start_codon:yes stop_codon:yes gene_type:complete
MVTYKDILRYLNSEMPDIGGIFQPPTSTPTPTPTSPSNPTDQVLTPEQLLLLQQQRRLAGGENDDGNTNIVDTTNNAGLTGIKGLATALSFMANPVGTMFGLGLKSKYDDFRNTGNLFGGNPNNIYRGIGEGSEYGTDLSVANMAQARGLTKQLNKVPLERGPNENFGRDNSNEGTFGSSTNDSNFSDYS